MRHPALLLSSLACAGLLAGCTAADENYPSLAPRPAEAATIAEPSSGAAAVPAAIDPALESRVAGLRAAAREGGDAFDAALGTTRAAVSAAGAAGSESWIAAQQAVTRLEQARTGVVSAVADLDALRLAQAQRVPPADTHSLDEAWQEASARDTAQAAALEALMAALPNP